MEVLLRIANAGAILGISFISAVIVITVHEFAHAFTSWSFGDKLPKWNKRVSLNPIRHIDIIGLLFMIASQFGWGKPVETSPKSYKDKKKSTILVGISGCAASILLAFVTCLFLAYIEFQLKNGKLFLTGYSGIYLELFLSNVYHYSLNLAFLSLLPFKPFDGLMIWGKFIPSKNQFKIIQYQGIIQCVFILIILISPEVLLTLIRPFGFILTFTSKGIVNLIF